MSEAAVIPLGAWLVLYHSGPDLFESEYHYLVFQQFRKRLCEDIHLINRLDDLLESNRTHWDRYISSLVDAAVMFNQDGVNKYVEKRRQISKALKKINRSLDKTLELFSELNTGDYDDIKILLLDQADRLKLCTNDVGPYHGLIKQTSNRKKPIVLFLSITWTNWQRNVITHGGKYPDEILYLTSADNARLAEMVLDIPCNSITSEDVKTARTNAKKYALENNFSGYSNNS